MGMIFKIKAGRKNESNWISFIGSSLLVCIAVA